MIIINLFEGKLTFDTQIIQNLTNCFIIALLKCSIISETQSHLMELGNLKYFDLNLLF